MTLINDFNLVNNYVGPRHNGNSNYGALIIPTNGTERWVSVW